jgi:hypothetical protein
MHATDRWTQLLSETPGSVVGVLSLDCSKAFDSIKHSSIITALKTAGLCESTLKLFTSYLNKREAVMKIGAEESVPIFPTRGVPQGSCLGPLLYILAGSLGGVPELSNSYVQFADDITLFTIGKDHREVSTKLEPMFVVTQRTLANHGLLFNFLKSQLMFVGTPHQLEKIPDDAIWLRAKEDITEDEYSEFYKSISKDHLEPLTSIDFLNAPSKAL